MLVAGCHIYASRRILHLRQITGLPGHRGILAKHAIAAALAATAGPVAPVLGCSLNDVDGHILRHIYYLVLLGDIALRRPILFGHQHVLLEGGRPGWLHDKAHLLAGVSLPLQHRNDLSL